MDAVDWDNHNDTEERMLVDWYHRMQGRLKDHRGDWKGMVLA